MKKRLVSMILSAVLFATSVPARLAENNRSRAKLLRGRVFAVLRERERALLAESGI